MEYYAANLTGEISLLINGELKQTLTGLDTDARAIDSVRLGAMGVEPGASDTLCFDDYKSRRLI